MCWSQRLSSPKISLYSGIILVKQFSAETGLVGWGFHDVTVTLFLRQFANSTQNISEIKVARPRFEPRIYCAANLAQPLRNRCGTPYNELLREIYRYVVSTHLKWRDCSTQTFKLHELGHSILKQKNTYQWTCGWNRAKATYDHYVFGELLCPNKRVMAHWL